MGDGRYYTFRQFFQILYLTILSGGLVFTIFYIQIKSREKERIRYIVVSCSFLLITIVISFIKEVTYEIVPAEILMFISLFGVIGAILAQIVYYNKKLIHTVIFAFFLIVITRFNFIDDFTFLVTTYSFEYKALVIFFVVCLLLYIFMDVLKKYKKLKLSEQGKNLKRYEWLESITIGGSISLAAISYCLFIVFSFRVPIHEISLLLCIVGFNVAFLKFMPHEKIPLGYHNLIENMVDTIIIINEKKEILYVNQTELSPYINVNEQVDFDLLGNLFKIDQVSLISLNAEVKQINGYIEEAVVSCKVSCEKIYNHNELVGYVLVIEDCSHLESMIQDLRDKKKSLTELETELSKYSRTSQVLSAEKERNRLLIEVQNELGHHLAELTKYIGNSIDYLEHEPLNKQENCEYMVNNIIQGITMARLNLSKIRATVRTYRDSYDGKGNEK